MMTAIIIDSSRELRHYRWLVSNASEEYVARPINLVPVSASGSRFFFFAAILGQLSPLIAGI
jgi:hypothetical protein